VRPHEQIGRTRPAAGQVAAAVAIAAAALADVRLLDLPRRHTVDASAPWAVLACVAATVVVAVPPPPTRAWARALAVAGAALLVIAVIVPPRQSRDLWAYAAYGRMVNVHHADPYRTPPAAFPEDAATARMDHGWIHARSVYGPAFTALSVVVDRVTGGAPLPTRLAYQGVAGVVVGGLVLRLLRRRSMRALAVLSLHPLVVVSLVNGGHADALVAGLVVVSTACIARGWLGTGGLAAGGAILVKAVAVFPLLGIAGWLAVRHRQRHLARAAVVVLTVVVGGYVIAGGTSVLGPMLAVTGDTSRTSVWHLLGLGHLGSGLSRDAALMTIVGVPTAVLAVSHAHRDPATAAGAASLPFLLASPYLLPWYLALALPIVLSDPVDTLLGTTLLVEAGLLVLAYQYRAMRRPDGLDRVLHGAIGAAQIGELVCLALILALAGSAVVRERRAASDRLPAVTP
jgi:hypothetical protein